MPSLSVLDEETVNEINANFSVITSTLDDLSEGLTFADFVTSYIFISKNIENTLNYLQDGIVSLTAQADKLEKIFTSSPLQVSFYRAHPQTIFVYRDAIRKFSDMIRAIVNNLYSNVSTTLAAYIFVYETLEKFKLKTPFILIESNDFIANDLNNFIFSIFDKLGEKPKYRESNAQVITYSGIDIKNPLSLLIMGHETFHVIDKQLKVFESFCKATGFTSSNCCEDAFIDIMSFIYFGPAYTYAVQNHFQKRYPLSGNSHLEMNIRMSILETLISTLNSSRKSEEKISGFIKTLEGRMDEASKAKAKGDKQLLDKMMDKDAVGFITNFFKSMGIAPYNEFTENIEKRDVQRKTEYIDRKKIIYMLKNDIPVAVRPVTLLNTLCETGYIDKIDSGLFVSSLKKWYVWRYYEKSKERQGTPDC
ncbi:MAG: hypothetical protein LBI79_07635 [Nitrososphaerota archaeon]|jgi:hypothetical protein|nr:hypothetical protein [Nitrososphaerota archaeon]